jgi:hypothetical protein
MNGNAPEKILQREVPGLYLGGITFSSYAGSCATFSYVYGLQSFAVCVFFHKAQWVSFCSELPIAKAMGFLFHRYRAD